MARIDVCVFVFYAVVVPADVLLRASDSGCEVCSARAATREEGAPEGGSPRHGGEVNDTVLDGDDGRAEGRRARRSPGRGRRRGAMAAMEEEMLWLSAGRVRRHGDVSGAGLWPVRGRRRGVVAGVRSMARGYGTGMSAACE